jgi:hypothetical protein
LRCNNLKNKRLKKGKRKRFKLLVGRGGGSGPAGRRARAGARLRQPSCGPRRETTWAREGDVVSVGPTRQRVGKGGGTAPAVDGGVNWPSAGDNPAAGGLGGDSPPVTRFLGNGQAP